MWLGVGLGLGLGLRLLRLGLVFVLPLLVIVLSYLACLVVSCLMIVLSFDGLVLSCLVMVLSCDCKLSRLVCLSLCFVFCLALPYLVVSCIQPRDFVRLCCCVICLLMVLSCVLSHVLPCLVFVSCLVLSCGCVVLYLVFVILPRLASSCIWSLSCGVLSWSGP
jgi:hypothetical protein